MPEAPQTEGTVEPQAASAFDALAALTDEELLHACKPRLCAVCPVQKEATETKLRSLAEVDNARKRMAREKEDFSRFAAEGVLADIVPSLDNLDLALRHATPDEACKNFVLGVDMTRKLLLESLKKHGLETVGVVGEEFNPALHEAVGLEDFPGVEENHVGKLLGLGYKLHERLLRPARVVVCKRG
ncbi:nucleotide exchange factor GrpE [Desulfovibrio cuneatus]|uniref:nucleotide exchange factor GrpE n=1 Tax=Desulfovibrio cuneatus TaxID=159728 RepID=UPI003F6DE435